MHQTPLENCVQNMIFEWYKSRYRPGGGQNVDQKCDVFAPFFVVFSIPFRYFAPNNGRRQGGTSQVSRLETIIFIGMDLDLYRPAALHCMGGAGGTAPSLT